MGLEKAKTPSHAVMVNMVKKMGLAYAKTPWDANDTSGLNMIDANHNHGG